VTGSRDAEVDDPGPVFGQQDVGRLEVAVHQTARMDSGQSCWPNPNGVGALDWPPNSALPSPMTSCGSSRRPRTATSGWLNC
jgi:hypothetical protein